MSRTDYGQGDYRVVADRLRPGAEDLVAWCDPEPRSLVLDSASGTGNVALLCARRGCRVIALDLEIALLRTMHEAGAAVPAVCGDAAALPLAAGSVDHVLSAFGMIYAPDPITAVLEAARVCRSGGVIGVTAWPADGFQTLARGVLADLDPEVGAAPGGVVDPAWKSEDRISELLGRVGGTVEVRRGQLETRHADAEEWWTTASTSAPPLVAARSRLTAGDFDALGHRLRELVDHCSTVVTGGLVLREEYLVARVTPR